MNVFQAMARSVLVLCLWSIPSIGNATSISLSDTAGLRSFNNGANVLLLGFTAVKPVLASGQEDRTIAHFNSGALSGTVPATFLNIPVANIDSGDPTGIFDVYSFAGDGIVSTDEWALGTLFHSFTGLEGGVQTLSVDITNLLQDAVNNSDPFLSFNFRSRQDRYNLSIAGLDDATIEAADASIPEPSSVLLLGAGLTGLLIRRKRKTA